MSQKDLDDAVGAELSAKASVEAAQASVEEAQLNLEFTKITSPVDGIAGIAKTQLGNLVGPNMSEELTSVSTVNPIKAYINVSEREYLTVRDSSQNVESIPLELSSLTAAPTLTRARSPCPTGRSIPAPAPSRWALFSPIQKIFCALAATA